MTFRVQTIEVTPLYQNARIVSAEGSGSAIVVDPGGDVPLILEALRTGGLRCDEIWLTHSHFDHCGGVAALKAATGALLRAHEAESYMRQSVRQVVSLYGLPDGGMENCPEPDFLLRGGEVLELAGERFEVRFTPGHSPGHVCFYHAPSGTLLAGDTVFQGSIGRTDLPGGDYETLMASIAREILVLPDAVKILPGHGPDTTVGAERRTNPFLRENDHA